MTGTLVIHHFENEVDSLSNESQDTKKIVWGIQAVEKHSSYHEDFYPLFIQYIRSDRIEISARALQYFQPSGLQDASLQKQLVEVMPGLSTEKKNAIIWKFIESGYATDEVVFELLTFFQEQKLNIGSLNLIYRLIQFLNILVLYFGNHDSD